MMFLKKSEVHFYFISIRVLSAVDVGVVLRCVNFMQFEREKERERERNRKSIRSSRGFASIGAALPRRGSRHLCRYCMQRICKRAASSTSVWTIQNEQCKKKKEVQRQE